MKIRNKRISEEGGWSRVDDIEFGCHIDPVLLFSTHFHTNTCAVRFTSLFSLPPPVQNHPVYPIYPANPIEHVNQQQIELFTVFPTFIPRPRAKDDADGERTTGNNLILLPLPAFPQSTQLRISRFDLVLPPREETPSVTLAYH